MTNSQENAQSEPANSEIIMEIKQQTVLITLQNNLTTTNIRTTIIKAIQITMHHLIKVAKVQHQAIKIITIHNKIRHAHQHLRNQTINNRAHKTQEVRTITHKTNIINTLR